MSASFRKPFLCAGEREEIMLLTQHRSPRTSRRLLPDRRAAQGIMPLRGTLPAQKAEDEKPSPTRSSVFSKRVLCARMDGRMFTETGERQSVNRRHSDLHAGLQMPGFSDAGLQSADTVKIVDKRRKYGYNIYNSEQYKNIFESSNEISSTYLICR
jgi:hypothetical protein